MKRPWKVIPGFSDGRGGYTFDNARTGIPARSFSTEARARAAAEAMVTPDADRCRFTACRLGYAGWQPLAEWPIGRVDEYVAHPTDGTFTTRTINVLEMARVELAKYDAREALRQGVK